MALLVMAGAALAYGPVKRLFVPVYWTADDLGPIAINQAKPPGPARQGMLWIPGGTYWMGSDYFQDAQPVHKIYVDGFWMDKTEVTNAEFRRFVEETKYVTVAEKTPSLAEVMKHAPPGPPPPKEMLVPGSLVFAAPGRKVPLDDISLWWKWTPGAQWRHPDGPGSDIKDNHPVVHIAYQDALAFCAWRSKKEGGTFRLPTEAEWEFAARGGLDRKPFTWGDEFKPKGKLMANTWQGEFPYPNTVEDGYAGIAPVAMFPANGFGLHDMAGNVWEWCSDWYQPKYFRDPARNPQGPSTSHDPVEPGIPKRVHRGGSYLCCDNYCSRYMAGGRGKGEPDSTTNHLGFRCVKAAS
ncbi:MAG TPA: formylglycine-generating enzyme family protein [Gemmataceae bacterium]|nr:formylglycine-generating enzyme family protein [Gemmataceae bacterium]